MNFRTGSGFALKLCTDTPTELRVLLLDTQNVPAGISGILAAESDQAVVFRSLTEKIVQAMEGLAGGPGA